MAHTKFTARNLSSRTSTVAPWTWFFWRTFAWYHAKALKALTFLCAMFPDCMLKSVSGCLEGTKGLTQLSSILIIFYRSTSSALIREGISSLWTVFSFKKSLFLILSRSFKTWVQIWRLLAHFWTASGFIVTPVNPPGPFPYLIKVVSINISDQIAFHSHFWCLITC